MYTKILVPLDGSSLAERAVNHAAEIARGSGAEILLIKVVTVPLSQVPEAGETEELKSIREVAAKAQAYLSGIASRLAKEGLNAKAVVLEGSAVEAILGFAHEQNVDVLVMSTHGRTGFSKVLMGSVAEQVMLTTKRPVMLVKPDKFPLAHHIDEGEVYSSAH